VDRTKDIEKARDFAIKAHWGQMYGDKPYIYHLDDVYSICKRHNLPQEVLVAAYLHDVVEDTPTTAQDIADSFGHRIACLVYSVTDEEGKNRKERKARTYRKIIANDNGIYLKLADRISNVRNCIKNSKDNLMSMYLKEADEFDLYLRTYGIAKDMWKELNECYDICKFPIPGVCNEQRLQ